MQTIVRDSRIEDGPSGTSSYLIETSVGGDLLVKHTVLKKGPNSSNQGVAISIGTQSVTNHTRSLTIHENTFRNDTPEQTSFVRNSTPAPARLIGTLVGGDVRVLQGPGPVAP